MEITKATPRIIRRRRDPLSSLSGLLAEGSRVYRKMKAGQLDHEAGRSLIWALTQLRGLVEARHLERIEVKLNELQATAENRGLIIDGHDSADPQARLPN
jgi:hypothetical protein